MPIIEGARTDLSRVLISELRERQNKTYRPTPDVDLVWVLSGPGTVSKSPSASTHAGAYKDSDFLPDKDRIEQGIKTVLDITALKVGKSPEQVTGDDVKNSGPVFFYNGENAENGLTQNEDLHELVNSPDFRLPPSQIVIRRLKRIYTPGQIADFAEYVNENPYIKKVAVVTHGPHARRVARYLNHFRGLFPADLEFIDAAFKQTQDAIGATWGEITRIENYAAKGDLSREPLY